MLSCAKDHIRRRGVKKSNSLINKILILSHLIADVFLPLYHSGNGVNYLTECHVIEEQAVFTMIGMTIGRLVFTTV